MSALEKSKFSSFIIVFIILKYWFEVFILEFIKKVKFLRNNIGCKLNKGKSSR